MKAQSELAGDRKRQAEMTCPRSRGVTTWITGVSENMSSIGKSIATAYTSSFDLPKVEFAPAFTEALASLCKPKINSEVNHRPAGQQCPVCTP